MSLLDIVFLLCARFIAIREKRSYGRCWDSIEVRFTNGAEPVVFQQELNWTDDGMFSWIHWTASRKLSKKETRIAERVLRCRLKRAGQKLPRGHSNTELYDAFLEKLSSIHSTNPMEYIQLNGKKIAYRTDAFGDNHYIDYMDYEWRIGTLQLCRDVVITPELLENLTDFIYKDNSPFEYKSYYPWKKYDAQAERLEQEYYTDDELQE
jgi:hypothetical protein